MDGFDHKLSLWSFVRLGGFLLVFGVLSAHGRLLWCCSKSETILGPCASNTRRDRRVDLERSKGGWRYHPAGALGKNTRQFFSIRMTDEQRYPPNPQSHPYEKREAQAETQSGSRQSILVRDRIVYRQLADSTLQRVWESVMLNKQNNF